MTTPTPKPEPLYFPHVQKVKSRERSVEVGRETALTDDDLPVLPVHDAGYVGVVVAGLQPVH